MGYNVLLRRSSQFLCGVFFRNGVWCEPAVFELGYKLPNSSLEIALHRWHVRGPDITALHLYHPDTAK